MTSDTQGIRAEIRNSLKSALVITLPSKPVKNIKIGFVLLLSILAILWSVTTLTLPNAAWPTNFLGWRALYMQFSGILAIGVMSVAMILAVRPVIFESYLDGLDKMYRLHKWLGISALIIGVSHWLMAKGPKWLVGLGWIERPTRGARSPIPVENTLQNFFAGQRGFAESVGEWAFYLAAILLILALVKRFPYKHFFKTHCLLAVAYLALVYHSIVLIRFDDWSGILGATMGILFFAGAISAGLVLCQRRFSKKRQVKGEISAIKHYQAIDFVTLSIKLNAPWKGHHAGQFAFLTLHKDEAAHPFSFSSAWVNDANGSLEFTIKGLGDYTRTLATRSKIGDPVSVEGPYGRFIFEGKLPRQIWIGGGIGVTPFLARLKALAAQTDGKTIDFFHTTTTLEPEFISELERLSGAAGITLHVLCDQRDGFLDAERLAKTIPDWQHADIWFCGPAGFGSALKKGLLEKGLPEKQFHQELFEMR